MFKKGTTLKLTNGLGVKVLEQLSEGGFAFVLRARDTKSKQEFALKQIVTQSTEAHKLAKDELALMQALPAHKHIVNLVDSGTHKGSTLICMELCTGGTLAQQLIEGKRFAYRELLEAFAQICRGVEHMHAQTPPIAHRDLKIENILISSSGVYKLCDFGSCTTRAKAYTERREILEESDNIQRYTTLIYRAPEMVDLYQAMHVGEKVDVWALGCILYTMSFGGKHPFAEGSALQIMSAEYTVPTTPEYPDDFIALLRALLTRKPEARCSTTEALTLLERLLATASEVALGAGPEPEAGDQVLEGWHMKKEKGREQKKRLFGRSSSGWDKVWLQLRDARLSFFAEPKAANALGFVELGQAHGGASTRAEQRADEGKHAHLWAIVVRSGAEHLFGPCSEEGDSAAKASRARWLAAVNAAAQMPAPAEKEDAPQPIRARSGMPSSAQSGDGTTGSADSFSGSFSELAPSTRGGAFDSLNSDTLPTQLEDVQPDAFDFGTGAFQGDAALADTAPGPAGGVLDAAAIRAATVSAMGLPPPASAAEEAFDFEVDFGQAEQQEDMLAADWASFDSPAPRFESPQPQAAAAADSSAPAAAAVTRTFISDAEREEANASLFSALDWKEDAAQPAAAKPAAVLSGFGGGGGGGGDSGGSKAGGASQAAPVSVHRPLYRVVPKSVSYHRELETSSKKLGTLPCGELIAEIESGTTKKGLLRIRFSRPDFGTDSVGWTSVVLPSLDSASSGKEKTGEKEKGVTLERIIDTHGSLHRTVSAEQEAQEEEEAAQEEAEEAEAAEAEVEAPYDFGDFGGVSLEEACVGAQPEAEQRASPGSVSPSGAAGYDYGDFGGVSLEDACVATEAEAKEQGASSEAGAEAEAAAPPQTEGAAESIAAAAASAAADAAADAVLAADAAPAPDTADAEPEAEAEEAEAAPAESESAPPAAAAAAGGVRLYVDV